jgi:transposase
VPKAPAAEFHVYVIATARKVGAPLRPIANDLGLYEACLHRWLKIADRDDGCRDRTGSLVARDESVELREVRKQNQAPQFTRIAAANFCRRNLVHPLSCNGLHGSMGHVGHVVTMPPWSRSSPCCNAKSWIDKRWSTRAEVRLAAIVTLNQADPSPPAARHGQAHPDRVRAARQTHRNRGLTFTARESTELDAVAYLRG